MLARFAQGGTVPRHLCRTAALVAALTVVAAGCGGAPAAPSTPLTPTPPSVPAPMFPLVTLTGLVTDAAGNPLASDVVVYPLRMTPAWSGPWGRGGRADASGRYVIADAPQHDDIVYVRAWRNGYVQQCATSLALAADANADLRLTPQTQAVTIGLPSPPNTRQISGTVFTMRNGEREPAAGVWVGWEAMMDTVVADTITDAQGRYRLCGLPLEPIRDLFAVRAGTNRPFYAMAAAGGETVVDFEIR